MSVKGNLREFSFIQLLNLVNVAKKTGALYIDGPAATAKTIFREGKVAYAVIGEETSDLLKMLVAAKMISPTQESLLRNRNKDLTDKEVGIYLMNSGYLSQEQIFLGIEEYITKLVRQLFTWTEGFFRFEVGELTPEARIPVRMSLEALIVEGVRLHQELEELKEEIPTLDMALKFTERQEVDIRNLNLTPEEWQVVSYVDPKNTMAQIARTAKMNELEIRKVVYALLQAGLVEIVRPGGVPLTLAGKVFVAQKTPEQKSLVNRLIDRIKSM